MVARTSDWDASWIPAPDPGRTQGMLVDYISQKNGSPEEQDIGQGKSGLVCLCCCPSNPRPDKWQKMVGWMNLSLEGSLARTMSSTWHIHMRHGQKVRWVTQQCHVCERQLGTGRMMAPLSSIMTSLVSKCPGLTDSSLQMQELVSVC